MIKINAAIRNTEGSTVKIKVARGTPKKIRLAEIIPREIIISKIIPAYEIRTLATRHIQLAERLFDQRRIARKAAIPPRTNLMLQTTV
ncbi:MAG: hypothetical protein KBT21_02030 [Treponema sp.]|nr:hypothetical protein [Candidatus Treponema merdequi]